MDQPLVQHPVRPFLRVAAKRPGQGTGGDLHPHPAMGELLHQRVMGLDPSQPLRMGEYGVVSCNHNIEKLLHQPLRGEMMRRFHQHISSVSQRQQMPRP